MDTETVIVTGANSGIGFELLLSLYRRGVSVIFTCRSEEKIMTTLEALKVRIAELKAKDEADNRKPVSTDVILDERRLEGHVLELTSVESVESFVDRIKAANKAKFISALVNNAGAIFTTYETTSLNLERTFHGNFFGPYLLTLGLLPLLIENARFCRDKHAKGCPHGVRIVNVAADAYLYPLSNLASILHPKTMESQAVFSDEDNLAVISALNSKANFSAAFYTYATSKFFNMWFNSSLAQYLQDFAKKNNEELPLYCNGLHPGVISTNISRNAFWLVRKAFQLAGRLFLITPAQGATASLYVTLSPDIVEKNMRGLYFKRVRDPEGLSDLGYAAPASLSSLIQDEHLRKRFMESVNTFVKKNLASSNPDFLLALP